MLHRLGLQAVCSFGLTNEDIVCILLMYYQTVIYFQLCLWSVVCRQIFCDFGSAFTVADTDGEQPTTVMVAGITKVIPTLGFEYVWFRCHYSCGLSLLVEIMIQLVWIKFSGSWHDYLMPDDANHLSQLFARKSRAFRHWTTARIRAKWHLSVKWFRQRARMWQTTDRWTTLGSRKKCVRIGRIACT